MSYDKAGTAPQDVLMDDYDGHRPDPPDARELSPNSVDYDLKHDGMSPVTERSESDVDMDEKQQNVSSSGKERKAPVINHSFMDQLEGFADRKQERSSPRRRPPSSANSSRRHMKTPKPTSSRSIPQTPVSGDSSGNSSRFSAIATPKSSQSASSKGSMKSFELTTPIPSSAPTKPKRQKSREGLVTPTSQQTTPSTPCSQPISGSMPTLSAGSTDSRSRMALGNSISTISQLGRSTGDFSHLSRASGGARRGGRRRRDHRGPPEQMHISSGDMSYASSRRSGRNSSRHLEGRTSSRRLGNSTHDYSRQSSSRIRRKDAHHPGVTHRSSNREQHQHDDTSSLDSSICSDYSVSSHGTGIVDGIPRELNPPPDRRAVLRSRVDEPGCRTPDTSRTSSRHLRPPRDDVGTRTPDSSRSSTRHFRPPRTPDSSCSSSRHLKLPRDEPGRWTPNSSYRSSSQHLRASQDEPGSRTPDSSYRSSSRHLRASRHEPGSRTPDTSYQSSSRHLRASRDEPGSRTPDSSYRSSSRHLRASRDEPGSRTPDSSYRSSSRHLRASRDEPGSRTPDSSYGSSSRHFRPPRDELGSQTPDYSRSSKRHLTHSHSKRQIREYDKRSRSSRHLSCDDSRPGDVYDRASSRRLETRSHHHRSNAGDYHSGSRDDEYSRSRDVNKYQHSSGREPDSRSDRYRSSRSDESRPRDSYERGHSSRRVDETRSYHHRGSGSHDVKYNRASSKRLGSRSRQYGPPSDNALAHDDLDRSKSYHRRSSGDDSFAPNEYDRWSGRKLESRSHHHQSSGDDSWTRNGYDRSSTRKFESRSHHRRRSRDGYTDSGGRNETRSHHHRRMGDDDSKHRVNYDRSSKRNLEMKSHGHRRSEGDDFYPRDSYQRSSSKKLDERSSSLRAEHSSKNLGQNDHDDRGHRDDCGHRSSRSPGTYTPESTKSTHHLGEHSKYTSSSPRNLNDVTDEFHNTDYQSKETQDRQQPVSAPSNGPRGSIRNDEREAKSNAGRRESEATDESSLLLGESMSSFGNPSKSDGKTSMHGSFSVISAVTRITTRRASSRDQPNKAAYLQQSLGNLDALLSDSEESNSKSLTSGKQEKLKTSHLRRLVEPQRRVPRSQSQSSGFSGSRAESSADEDKSTRSYRGARQPLRMDSEHSGSSWRPPSSRRSWDAADTDIEDLPPTSPKRRTSDQRGRLRPEDFEDLSERIEEEGEESSYSSGDEVEPLDLGQEDVFSTYCWSAARQGQPRMKTARESIREAILGTPFALTLEQRKEVPKPTE